MTQLMWSLHVCPIPDCIHAFVLSDELDELLDSQTELKTALPRKQIKEDMMFKPLESLSFVFYEAGTLLHAVN